MTYSTPPPNLRSLEQRTRNLEADDASSLRRQVTMAMVVVGQMLPEGAVKGGTAMALRYGRGDSRFTQDLDAARAVPLTDSSTTSKPRSIMDGPASRVGWLIESRLDLRAFLRSTSCSRST